MGDFDDFPVKPKFHRGDRVYHYVLLIEGEKKIQHRLEGVVRHVRASVQIEDVKPKTKTERRKKAAGELVNPQPLVGYGYQVGFEGEMLISNVIPENELFHANPLLRLVDET